MGDLGIVPPARLLKMKPKSFIWKFAKEIEGGGIPFQSRNPEGGGGKYVADWVFQVQAYQNPGIIGGSPSLPGLIISGH
ncbi:hypothetical protein MNBD_BACTEROID01-2593 [hydrothermal vent metagenome]|uniref:Uncharacterized protein n=1 Tax=hydrothermal vent metagenome TaxID=652676 RepID=A0A3B0UV03_9ZZZZ